MRTETFTARSLLPVPIETAFAWHERPGAIDRLLPPWEDIRVLRRSGGIRQGDQVELVNRVGPLRLHLVAEHREYEPPRRFRDVQRSGPFAHWDHQHLFDPETERSTVLEDRIEYAVSGGWLGKTFAGNFVRRKIERMFAYRHATTIADLFLHQRHQEKGTMHVAITGSSGLIGSELRPLLTTGGHRVTSVTRHKSGEDEVEWDIEQGTIEADKLEGVDAVVHLAGENIAAGRWTAKQKARIRDSRVQGTRLLCETLSKLDRKPRVLVAASATGYYGNRGDEVLTEESAPGTGFLAEVCQQWEGETRIAAEAGIRVVNLRFGVVLSPQGGALQKMLLPFKMGVGGRVGSGQQYWSWIGRDDAAGAIHHAIMTDGLSGPVNAVAPEPVTNHEFTKTLGRVLSRPTIFPMPAFAAKLALGEMADELLLTSFRVLPKKLQESDYQFRHPALESALRFQLGRM